MTTNNEEGRLNPHRLEFEGLKFFDHPYEKRQRGYVFNKNGTDEQVTIPYKDKGEIIRFTKKYGLSFYNQAFKHLEWKRLLTSLYAKARSPYSTEEFNIHEHNLCKGTGKIELECFDYRFTDSNKANTRYGFCRRLVQKGKEMGAIAIDYTYEEYCNDHEPIVEEKCIKCDGTGKIRQKKSCKFLRASYYTDDPIDIIPVSKYKFRVKELPQDYLYFQTFITLLSNQYNRSVQVEGEEEDGYQYFTLKKEWEKEKE